MKKLLLATVFGLSLLATPSAFAIDDHNCLNPPECMDLSTNLQSQSTSPPVNKITKSYLVPITIAENHMNFVSGTINEKITVDFAIDSGASITLIPEDIFHTLMRMGAIKQEDMREKMTSMMADGTSRESQKFVITSLKIGDYIAKDVLASIGPSEAPLLLGENFLSKFKSWTIDNDKEMLVLDE